jgi:hypothetical protein
MDWQLATVIVLVAAALLYLCRRAWRTWGRANNGCGGGCGCAKAIVPPEAGGQKALLIPPEQLTLRRRGTQSLSQNEDGTPKIQESRPHFGIGSQDQ